MLVELVRLQTVAKRKMTMKKMKKVLLKQKQRR